MQHLKARQRESDSLWDFTTRLGERISPIGYCRKFTDPDDWNLPVSEEEKKRIRSHKDKYHDDGHETAEEACECYKEYLLDQPFRIEKSINLLNKCQICEAWTSNRISVGQVQSFTLCDKHNTRDALSTLFKDPIEIWES